MNNPIDGGLINRIAQIKAEILDGSPGISPGIGMSMISPEIDFLVSATKGMPRNDSNPFLSCLAVIVRLRDLLTAGLKNQVV
jgi:hypothetical protein